MRLEDIVLYLLFAQNESEIEGKTKLQKLIFLIEQRIKNADSSDFESFEFVPYNYGPYSEKLNKIINNFINRKLVKHVKTRVIDYPINRYILSPEGANEIKNISKNTTKKDEQILKIIDEIKKDFNELSLHNLIVHVYKNYPNYVKSS